MISSQKIFCIGMFKTGTTSLGSALDILGYKTKHGPWWPKQKMIVDDWFRRPRDWKNYGDVIFEETKKFQAFEDYPWMWCFDMCWNWYPTATFIWTKREPTEVAESEHRWWKRMGKKEIPPKEAFIERYKRHEQMVYDFCYQHDDFRCYSLNICAGQGWKELCSILEKPVPDVPFPHNKRTK